MSKYEFIIWLMGLLYELISRVYPTRRKWSLIGLLIKLLKALDDVLDNKKKPYRRYREFG